MSNEDKKWTPVLRGKIYCSPRCGFDCTKAAHDKAVRESAALCEQLGEGWHPRVWENCGWHWDVSKGVGDADDIFSRRGVIVRRDSDGSYRAEFRSVENGASATTQFFSDATTAEEAIGLLRQDVRTFVRRLEADLAASI